MLIPNFSESEIRTLYAQHTEESGQVFADGVVEDVWRLTRGQPWLVNAIAGECIEEIHGYQYDEAITVADVEAAKESIIKKNPVHLDYLFYMMRHPRVEPIFKSILDGRLSEEERQTKEFRFITRLGIFREEGSSFEFANPVYERYWETVQ